MNHFEQIASNIIKEQELVIGPLAWSEAKKVPGLKIVDEATWQIAFTDSDPKKVIDLLVAQYERLFGRASHEVCKEAAAGIISHLSPSDIPASLLT